MASGETSFNSYTFTDKWTVNDLEARLYNPSDVKSPVFSSPNGARPATKWMLVILSGDCSTFRFGRRSVPINHQHLSIELQRQRAFNLISKATASQVTKDGREQGQTDEDIWVEANLKPPTIITKKNSKLFNHALPAAECTSRIKGPTKLSKLALHSKFNIDDDDSSVISFKQFLETSKVRDSECVIFECEIKVWSLDKPVHVTKDPSPFSSHSSDFNLSMCMEEARQSHLFTDVTLVVADGKEYKAHKVVLASQSEFFKTRFSNRWTSSLGLGDRVELTDIPAVVMEAVLSYMYTGKVKDIEKIAYKLLPVAKKYGLVGLRKMCEEALARSLKSSTAIITLMYASVHNASDLKKACMEFIVSNIASVKQSEWWSKLKEEQLYRELWVELLEYIVSEKHSTPE